MSRNEKLILILVGFVTAILLLHTLTVLRIIKVVRHVNNEMTAMIQMQEQLLK